jgi:hypothetical protein
VILDLENVEAQSPPEVNARQVAAAMRALIPIIA